jgi:hypothetical protein
VGSLVADIEGEHFLALARNAVYNYSEIDLTFQEFLEIADKLLVLVHKKSFTKISGLDSASFTSAAGITIADLLEVLSISRTGYETLLAGGDTLALKNSSIIQRKFQAGGASESTIKYLCESKVSWDAWFRSSRHVIAEFDANKLMSQFHEAAAAWVAAGGQLTKLYDAAETLRGYAATLNIQLTDQLCLGGVLSEIVRSEA